MVKKLQRAITPTELAPSPYFSIINVHLVDINAEFYEIPSLPFQDTEKPKRRRWTDGHTEGHEKKYTPQQTQFVGE